MKNKKRVNIFLLLILLLGVSIGFAILSRQLNIFGTSNIFASKWNIHWDNIANENGMIPKTAAYIKDEAKTIVEFEMNFTDPGDYYEFTVDAVNEGTMDASLLEIKAKVNDQDISTLPSYLEYTFKYADGTEPQIGDVLAKKVGDVPGRKTYKVKIYFNEETFTEEMLEDMPDNGLDLVFTFSAKYGQAGVEAPNNFATDPWPTIEEEGNESAKQESTDGTCGAYHVGDTKEVDLGDLGVHTVRIANCSTPPECKTGGFSQTACGFVLEFTDILSKHRMNAVDNSELNGNYNTGGWEYSDMRAYLNNGIYTNTYRTIPEVNDYSSTGLLSKLPSNLIDKIADTTVVSGHGCKENDWYDVCVRPDNDGNNYTTTDKLYLLSVVEVIGKVGNNRRVEFDSAIDQSRQLDYYESSGLTPDVNSAFSGQKTYDGSYAFWITRTPYDNHYSPWYGISDYSSSYEEASNTVIGVSPAFKLK